MIILPKNRYQYEIIHIIVDLKKEYPVCHWFGFPLIPLDIDKKFDPFFNAMVDGDTAKAKRALEKIEDDPAIVTILKSLVHFYEGNIDSSITCLEDFIRENEIPDEKERFYLLYNLERNYQSASNLEKAKECLEELSKIKLDERMKLLIENEYGGLFWYLDKYEKARERVEGFLEKVTEMGDLFLQETAHNLLGIIQMEIGDYGRAIDSLNRSLEISEEIGDRLGVARAELNIGEAYRQTGAWERAKEFFNLSVESAASLKGFTGFRLRADCYINLGDISMLENRTDEAKEYYERALEEATDIGETQIIVRIYLGLAKVCIEQKSFYEALDHLDKAHESSSGSKRYKAETYALRGRVNEEQRRYREALQSYGLAIFLFREINNKYGIAHMEEAIGMIYAKIGNKERSLEYLRRAKEKYASFASIIDLENIDRQMKEVQTL